jgi:hypothetical protein
VNDIATADELLNPSTSTWRSDLFPIALAVAIFSAASVWMAIHSDGFLEADSVTHYLYARFAIVETHYLVNIWGRPFVTALYAIPAFVWGRMGVRVTSLILALICGFVAYALARGQKHRMPALALIFTLAQPLVFLHSFSELTELPFAALLGLAFLAYQRRQFLVMTILIALSPTARPEGFGFILLAALALIVHRRWWWIPLLAVPLLVWDYLGWHRYGSPVYQTSWPQGFQWLLWLKHEWPYAQQSLYESGSIFHYVMLLPAIVSPFLFPAMCVGVWEKLSKARSLICETASGRHRGLSEVLIAVIPLLILLGHSILYATGKMASSGEMRYMLIVAPFWGLLSACGWVWIFERMTWRWPLQWAAVAAIAPALLNNHRYLGPIRLGYEVLPIHLNEDMVIARRVARWYQNWPYRDEYPHLLAAHPGVYYFMNISPTQRLESREWTKQTIAATPHGTILIWDPIYGVYNSDANRSVSLDSIENAGWAMDEQTSDLINNSNTPDDECWSVWLSPQSQSGAPPPE